MGQLSITSCRERLQIDRIHVLPRTIELASAAACRRYRYPWDAVRELMVWLRPLPAGFMWFWLGQPGGHVVLTHAPSRYESGDYVMRTQVLSNVSEVCVSDLAERPQVALMPIGRMLDHMLGGFGGEEEAWFSDGVSSHTELRSLAGRFHESLALGYVADSAATADPRSCFARAFALYLCDRETLNTKDPRLEALFRRYLLSASFWRSSGKCKA